MRKLFNYEKEVKPPRFSEIFLHSFREAYPGLYDGMPDLPHCFLPHQI